MKKLLLFIGFMLVTTVAQAENTFWIKGGLSFYNEETFCADSNPSFGIDPEHNCGNNFNGKNFFIQVSPGNVRGKLNGSKLGYRVEPWIGYSQTGKTDAAGDAENYGYNNAGELDEYEQVKLTNLTVKSFQFGTNLFLDYEVLPDLTIYGGPVAGFELSKITTETAQFYYDLDTATGVFVEEKQWAYNRTSGWSSNFIYGAEVGGEYKITKTVALGAFAGILQHSDMVDSASDSQWNQGVEIRAGSGLTFYW